METFSEITAPEQPLHPRCRCIMVMVLIDDSENVQAGMNYKDWFEGRPEHQKIDILGLNRYKLYREGMEINQFALDGRVLSLRELGISREMQITKRELLRIFDFSDVMPSFNGDGDRAFINEFLDKAREKIESLEKETEYVMNVGIKAGNNREFASIFLKMVRLLIQ